MTDKPDPYGPCVCCDLDRLREMIVAWNCAWADHALTQPQIESLALYLRGHPNQEAKAALSGVVTIPAGTFKPGTAVRLTFARGEPPRFTIVRKNDEERREWDGTISDDQR